MRAQKGGQKGPKRRQKRDQNDIEILIDFGAILEAQGDPGAVSLRNARGLARLFEFEEFEQEFEEDFEIHSDTLRPFGRRRI